MNYSNLRNKCFLCSYLYVDIKSGCQLKKSFKFKNSSQLQKFIQRLLKCEDFIVCDFYISIFSKDIYEHICADEHSLIYDNNYTKDL